MSQANINSSLYQEALGRLAIRFIIVATLAIGCYFLVALAETLQNKAILAITVLSMFFYIPRIFYHRYTRVIVNEELKIGFKPKGFWERFIFATRKTLASPVIVFLTSLIAFKTLITQNQTGILIICSSFVFYIAFEFVLNTPIFSKIFRADKIPSVYPFYRRWISIMLTACIAFCLGMFVVEPAYNLEDSFKVIASAVATDISNTNSYFLIFMQALDITVGLDNYALALTADTAWYNLAKAILIALPFAIFSIHISLSISLITLSRYRIKQVIKPQEWVATNHNFFYRHWKTAALPIFLLCFFGGIYHLGYPYYLKYQDKILMKEAPKPVVADAEIIGDEYYKLGTIKSIQDAKLQAIAQLKALLKNSVNETNNVFNDCIEMSTKFVPWFVNRNQQYPFKLHDKQLKQAIISMLNVKQLNLQLANISKDLSSDVYNVYTDLGIFIDTTLSNNKLPRKKEGLYTAKISENNGFITNLSLDNNVVIEINSVKQFLIQLPNLEKELTNDVDVSSSIWFEAYLNAQNQAQENELLAEGGLATEENNYNQKLNSYLARILNDNAKSIKENFAKAISLPLLDSYDATVPAPIIDESENIEEDNLLESEAMD